MSYINLLHLDFKKEYQNEYYKTILKQLEQDEQFYLMMRSKILYLRQPLMIYSVLKGLNSDKDVINLFDISYQVSLTANFRLRFDIHINEETEMTFYIYCGDHDEEETFKGFEAFKELQPILNKLLFVEKIRSV